MPIFLHQKHKIKQKETRIDTYKLQTKAKKKRTKIKVLDEMHIPLLFWYNNHVASQNNDYPTKQLIHVGKGKKKERNTESYTSNETEIKRKFY